MFEPIAFSDAPSPFFDRQPLPQVSLDALNFDAVAAHIKEMLQRHHDRTVMELYGGSEDPQEYLLKRGCIVMTDRGARPTVAGILCFGNNPQEILPQAVIDMGRFRGVTPVSSEVLDLQKRIGGTIIEQITHIENYLWSNSNHGMSIGAGGRRIEMHEYPRVVIRELLANMVAHRDYRITTSVARVEKLRDRIQWISPGGLPEGVTIENLLTAQLSRNPTLMQVLVDTGFVEAFGMGLDTVVTALQRANMKQPVFQDFKSFFMVTVYGRSQDEFTSSAIAQRLTDRQLHILTFIQTKKEARPQDILDLFAERFTPRSIQRDLKDMINAGLILADGKGRATVYRICDQESAAT
jgi:ATP-dependent DNA helicase RecG